jgi:hypothetical protein
VSLINSPSWNIHPVYCNKICIDNVRIESPYDSPNTDGINPDSCSDVIISNCQISCGDDCISLKSGYNADGRRVAIPCENVLISNCIFKKGYGGIVIGSEMSGDVRNVNVSNCIFDGTDQGLRVKTEIGRGGVVESFLASNLLMRNVNIAFSINAKYISTKNKYQVNSPEEIPILRNFNWSSIHITNCKKIVEIFGLKEMPVSNINFNNILVEKTEQGIFCEDAGKILFRDIILQSPIKSPIFNIRNSYAIDIKSFRAEDTFESLSVIVLENVKNLSIKDFQISKSKGSFLKLIGLQNRNIKCNLLECGNRGKLMKLWQQIWWKF